MEREECRRHEEGLSQVWVRARSGNRTLKGSELLRSMSFRKRTIRVKKADEGNSAYSNWLDMAACRDCIALKHSCDGDSGHTAGSL